MTMSDDFLIVDCCQGRQLHFAVAVVAVFFLHAADTTFTSCTTSAAVEGHPTTVICHFHEDVWVYERHVNVLRYDLDGQLYVPELALKCYRPDAVAIAPKCTTSNGFEFNGELGTSLTLTIRNATMQHAGVYMCASSATERENQHNCTLHVKGKEISCKHIYVDEVARASLTCLFNSDLRLTKDDFYVRYSSNGSFDYVDVVRCNWLKDQSQEQPFCISNHGHDVTVDSNGREVRIDIPAATLRGDGNYFCDTVGLKKGVTVKTCQVRFNQKTTTFLPPTTRLTTTKTALMHKGSLQEHVFHEPAVPEDFMESTSAGVMFGCSSLLMFFCFICS